MNYSGGCQCGKVRFEVALEFEHVISCNCSRCAKLGQLLAFAPAADFKLVSGEDATSDYQFNKHVIHHLFCTRCGIQSFARGKRPGDGADMVAPSGEGAVRCMRMALEGVDTPVDYLNTHGTSTPLGDIVELASVREAFDGRIPPLSSTKALSGHSLGAASVHEAIYCLLMMQGGFMAGSANIEQIDPKAEGFPILRESRDATLRTVMSNSFGFGGTNGTLVFRTPE